MSKCVHTVCVNVYAPCSLVIRWRFVDRVKEQMNAFMSGLNELIPQHQLSIFDANEIEVGVV